MRLELLQPGPIYGGRAGILVGERMDEWPKGRKESTGRRRRTKKVIGAEWADVFGRLARLPSGLATTQYPLTWG